MAPTRQAGYTYIRGPEGLIVEGFERTGDSERLGQIDMWQEDPVCAELWYAAHLGATRRAPVGRAGYGDVALLWYTRPGDQPLVSTLGQAVDHLAFAVADLDAWVAKFTRENVRILRPPYPFGSSRAVLIEGPSREAIEVVELLP